MLFCSAALTTITASALNEMCFMQRWGREIHLDTCQRNSNALPGSRCGKHIMRCMSNTFSVCSKMDASVDTTVQCDMHSLQ